MTSEKGGISVVIPVYRNKDTVVAALDSVRRQSRQPSAVIVVDDGSDDGSGERAARFPAVELVRQPNRGPAAARNAGWQRCATEWVAFLDADDTWEPDKLRLQLEVAAGRPPPAIVACDWMAPGTGSGPPGPGRSTTRLSTLDILLLNRFQTSTVLARRHVLEENGGFDSSLDGAED